MDGLGVVPTASEIDLDSLSSVNVFVKSSPLVANRGVVAARGNKPMEARACETHTRTRTHARTRAHTRTRARARTHTHRERERERQREKERERERVSE